MQNYNFVGNKSDKRDDDFSVTQFFDSYDLRVYLKGQK